MKLLNALSAKLILLLLIPLLYLLFPSSIFAQTVPGGTTIFSDNFTDANGTSLSAHNSIWRITEGSALIENNQLAYQYPYFRGSIPTYTTDQCVSFDLQFPTTGRNEIWLRAADSPDTVQNGYYIRLDNQGSSYDFAVADLEGTLPGFSFPSSVSSGMHNYKGCIIGNQISVYLDNVSLGSGAAHSDFISGYPRIGGNQGNIIDNYVYTGVLPVTPTPTPMVQINSSPSTSSVTVGSPFTVNVTVNSTGQSFNAAQSTVSVSSNLSVTGIKSPSSNSCNFDFTKTPTMSNPSFAGGIYGTSSTGCTAYTMVLTPTSSGTGTVTFTNASVKAYADSSE
ncbi:MAG: hypothetical protein KGJ07_09075, partial [Patescibacteria group bacterium]|nr:hypothetical protein [Patescibacteria group bacterium]